MTTFGVHTGLQNTTIDELRDLWTHIEDAGFDWISIWDHFYSADFTGFECHEAVACHAALACDTSRVRVGSLVYCAGSRPPAVLDQPHHDASEHLVSDPCPAPGETVTLTVEVPAGAGVSSLAVRSVRTASTAPPS